MNWRSLVLDEILPCVSKPAQYLGTEWNAVHKDTDSVELRVCLAFPDLYELGLGNLGLHVLYAILNQFPWCWAERAYAPAPDLEAVLRAREMPLFTLESKTPLLNMDLIGFTLQSELTYTSVLNMIDRAGLPLRSEQRTHAHPIVIAGGPGALNPEPMAPFIDAFVVGDGEEVIGEIVSCLRGVRRGTRQEKLESLNAIAGVWAPALHDVKRLANGAIVSNPGRIITRRTVSELDAAPAPESYLVPFAQLVHDRAGIEIMRGCAHGCRFCQAGMISRPVRTRSIGAIERLVDETFRKTGYEEISLLSLSSCDYPEARTLFAQAARRAHADDAAVSAPSLRLDTFAVELADAISGVRRSGLTFAPEAATKRLRVVINKNFDNETLFTVIEEAMRRGWQHVKCYFMIGLPTETDEDVEAIAALCREALARAKQINRRARITTGVSTFVPKPFTPFQWAGQIGFDEIRRRQAILARELKPYSAIKFGYHEAESSLVEGLISRGDRRAADLIESAFRHGARLDSSSDLLDMNAWGKAIGETQYPVDAMLGERPLDAPLPWDYIDAGVSADWLRAEWARALAGAVTSDCRWSACNQCGVREALPGECNTMQARWRETAEHTENDGPVLLESRNEPLAVQRVRFRVGRFDEARFLSNLEWIAAWIRALRRARLPVSHSQGFHAHPKVTFSTAPPVGEESEADYMDVLLRDRIAPEQCLARLQAALPQGLCVYEAAEVPLAAPSLMSAVTGCEYLIFASADAPEVLGRIRSILESPNVSVERKGRPTGPRRSPASITVDIRPAIAALALEPSESDRLCVRFSTCLVAGRLAKTREIVHLLGLDPQKTRVRKIATRLRGCE